MWTFTTLGKLFILLVLYSAITSGEEEFEIEIVEIDEFEIASSDEPFTGETEEPGTDPDVMTIMPGEPTMSTDDGVTEPTGEPVTEPESTPEGPIWEDYHTRINIFNMTEDQFISQHEPQFKASVANYTEIYCNQTEGAPCTVEMPLTTPPSPNSPPSSDDLDLHINAVRDAQNDNNLEPDDVEIERRAEVGTDLQIGFYVELANNFRLPRDTLDTVMEIYGDNIAEESGITFILILDPITTTEYATITTSEPEATPAPDDLEPWEIALIVLGSVGGAAIIAGLVYYFVFRKKDSSQSFGQLDYESTSIRLYDQQHPAHTYESLDKNRQSIPPDSHTGSSRTFNNAAYENSEYDEINENDNRRSQVSADSTITLNGKAWSAAPYTRL